MQVYGNKESHETRKPATERFLFRVVTSSFPAAAAAYCHGEFHVKRDTLYLAHTKESKHVDFANRAKSELCQYSGVC